MTDKDTRPAMEQLLDKMEWKKVDPPVENGEPPDSPFVTHEGYITLADGVRFKVLQLSNGQRIIPIEELNKLFSAS